MKKLRDFKCVQCNTVAERLVNDDQMTISCLTCGEVATRQLSAPAGTGNAAHGFMAKAKKG